MNSKTIKIIVFIISGILILSIILTTAGCSKLDIEIFGLKFGEKAESTYPETEDFESTDEESTGGTQDNTENSTDISTKDDIDSDNKNTNTGDIIADDIDIPELRSYYARAMKYYFEGQDHSYFIAEYYLNKIKDDYLVLQDHVFYYMAKTLFSQGKYEEAEEYYLKLIKNYPDSIWAEKASLEYADMFYIREDHITAENEYEHFRTAFPHSSYIPYCLFQLATCQEMNGKKGQAFENYKEIWLNHPSNEYSEIAWENLNKLSEDSSIEPFIPTANQIYNRGKIFFDIYHYNSALDEFNKILQEDYLNELSPELHSKTLFKKGMCYYNLRDYNQAKYYLSLSYEKSPYGPLADDGLYYFGRSLTNLNLTADAISYYQKLLKLFPNSNYDDDALYRTGRIYSLKGDFKNAASYFQRISNDYPGGDRLPDALWELGWIQYKSDDYSAAENTFSNYASLYEDTALEERGLFWQAKCCQKLGNNNKAAELYQKIIDLNSYSYYTFASGEMLADMNKEVQIKKINIQLNPDENPHIADIVPDVYSIFEEDSYAEDSEINHINKAIELLKLEFFNSASLEIEAGSSEIKENPTRALEIATLYKKSNNYANSINIIGKNLKQLKSGLNEPYTDYLYYLYYPYGYKELVQKYSSQYDLDPLFTLAVIKQESNFVPDAGSYAGAQGLMQIMPATGKGIASKIGIPNYNVDLLLDPDINIRMGTSYLKQILDNFDQNMIYCLGAYNGGPGRMSDWVSKRGNMDIDEFIESISYEQSREYVKKVMGNYYFYQMLYD